MNPTYEMKGTQFKFAPHESIKLKEKAGIELAKLVEIEVKKKNKPVKKGNMPGKRC